MLDRTVLSAYGLLDIDIPRPVLPEGVRYPVWIKPVDGASSHGAYLVRDDAELRTQLPQVRAEMDRLGRPLQEVMGMVELPPEIARIAGMGCLVEGAVSGKQMTVEGFGHDGEVIVYGVIASYDYPGSVSFLRYQYPRHSQSHAAMFEMVDGLSNHQTMIDVALGRTPQLQHRKGPHGVAAKWFLRRFRDGVVRTMPSGEQIAAAERDLPGTTVKVTVHEGERLSDRRGEDEYSYVLATVFTSEELTERLEVLGAAVAELDVEVDQSIAQVIARLSDVGRDARETYSFTARDVSSVRGETTWEIGFGRGDWSAGATTRTVLTSSGTDFHLYAELDAWDGAERVHSATWSRSIPRDNV